MPHRATGFTLGWLLLLALAAVGPAGAQSLTVRVLEAGAEGSAPLAGAWVVAHATGQGEQTSGAGEAVLTAPGGGVISAQKPGYTAAIRAASDAQDGVLTLTLARGDVTRDGAVDLVDVAALVPSVGLTADDAAQWQPALDFDGSGAVDADDLGFVAAQQDAARRADGDAPAYRLIDDAEDDDAQTELGRGSYWQVLSDVTFNGGSSTTDPPSATAVAPVEGGAAGSDRSVRYSYRLGEAFEFRFALLRALLTADDAVGIDATEYAGIEFWLKGNGVPLVVSFKSGPTSIDFHEYEHAIDAAPSEWTRYRLRFDSDFQQPGWGTPQPIEAVAADLEAIQFKASSGAVGEEGTIWVDNLQFFYDQAGPTALVAGQVRDASGAAVPYARVTVESGGRRRTLAGGDGRYEVEAISGSATVVAQRAGFAPDTVVVAVQPGETVAADLTLTRLVPQAKPASTGDVRIAGTSLEVDFDADGTYEAFQVRGAAFSVAPIGSSGGVSDTRIFDRSQVYLDSLGVNTIRTYSGLSDYMMDLAADIDVRVIQGFWVDYSYDLSDPARREQLIDEFRAFVRRYKDHPALLMWTLGNEQNYENGDNAFWYSLAEELAVVAYEEEGDAYHPVTINNGNDFNIGDASVHAADAQLPYTDAWASNVYAFDLQSFMFAPYRSATGKPLVVTEFGIDALDDRTKQPYEQVQADFDVRNWQQIDAAGAFVLGGTVFEFTDEWWKDGDPLSHDFGGYPTGAHPDGYSNEEWWGLIAVTPDTDGDGLDEWRARPAFQALRALWTAD